MQVSEYAMLTNELNQMAALYCGVLSVENNPPDESEGNARVPTHLTLDEASTGSYTPLTSEQINTISALPYISSTDRRYMTAGYSDVYDRMDDRNPLYDFAARIVIEGTVSELIEDEWGGMTIRISDFAQLAGRNANTGSASYFELYSYMENPDQYEHYMHPLIIGDSRASVIYYRGGHEYGYHQLSTMNIGERYVIVARVSVDNMRTNYIGDYLTDAWCEAVWLIEEESHDYLDLEKYASLRELIEITNADIHTFDIVYTENMNAIPKFAGGMMAIEEGRAITHNDGITDTPVCVVSTEFARRNGVSIGDKITFAIGSLLFEQYLNLGAIAGTHERYLPPENEITFQIVGKYTFTEGTNARSRSPHFGYSINTIFVPVSILTVDESLLSNHAFAPGEVSFVVDNARDIRSFIDESIPIIDGTGLTFLDFYDGGWLDLAEEFEVSTQLSMIKVVSLSIATVAVILFIVYIYITRRKKEYAIMRALGTPKKIAAKSLAYPLFILAAISIVIGIGVSWIYTSIAMSSNNTGSFLPQNSDGVTIYAGIAVGCLLAQALMILVFTSALLIRNGNQPLLLLLQSGKVNNKMTSSRSAEKVRKHV